LRLFRALLFLSLLVVSGGSVFADPIESHLLPMRLGTFRQVSTYAGSPVYKPGLFGGVADGLEQANFIGKDGNRLVVEIIRFRQDIEAYEFLSLMAASYRPTQSNLEIHPGYGTAGYVSEKETAFFKGRNFVRLIPNKKLDSATRDALVAELTARLDNGDGDIPVLIKHLPNYEDTQKTAVYLHGSDPVLLGLKAPVFSAIDVESWRNADAVRADYGPSKLVIIEFNTPQLAGENDRRIIAVIQQLWNAGQPAPTAYRRVGNYCVFVFDAPNDQTGKQLIDQVKYEQVVQWLGDNPNILKEAEKRYINTTLGVLVAVLKASGYALVLCFGIGGLIGGLLFSYRRAQQKDATAFSDAGGMLRLNLDELSTETNPSRLLRERN
jgi:uncharacterized protein DUF6599